MVSDSIDIYVELEGFTSDTTAEIVVRDQARESRPLLAFVWSLSLVPTLTTLMFLDEDITTLVRRFVVEAVVLIIIAVWVERRSTRHDA